MVGSAGSDDDFRRVMTELELCNRSCRSLGYSLCDIPDRQSIHLPQMAPRAIVESRILEILNQARCGRPCGLSDSQYALLFGQLLMAWMSANCFSSNGILGK